MENYRHILKFFLFGFLFAAFLNYIPSCTEKKSPVQPEDQNNTGYFESQELKDLSDSLITAYKSEDKTKVIHFLSDDSKEVYSNILNSSNESLAEYGAALENRKLIFANQLYAEYEITLNQTTYSIAYGNGGDGKWQLLRF